MIGRGDDCQLRPQSGSVSRRHAEIVIEDGRVVVSDMGSSNGTLVNGERIKAERELKTGDHLTVGPLEFEVQLAVSVGGKKKPKVHNVQEAAARTVEVAGDEDADIIDDWLADEEEEDSADTSTVDIEAIRAAASAKQVEPPEEEPKESSDDTSRSAANEMLKQFFGQDGQK